MKNIEGFVIRDVPSNIDKRCLVKVKKKMHWLMWSHNAPSLMNLKILQFFCQLKDVLA